MASTFPMNSVYTHSAVTVEGPALISCVPQSFEREEPRKPAQGN
jgi:hypothetical protein